MRRLLVALLLVASPAAAGVLLTSTDSIELVTSSSANVDYTASWADATSSAFTPGTSTGTVASATTTTAIAAPAASTYRSIRALTVRNTHASTSNTVTVQTDVSGTNRVMFIAALGAGESLTLGETGTWTLYTAAGLIKTQAVGAPVDPTYLTQTPDATLTGEQAMSALGTGLVVSTTGTGVQSIYGGTSCSGQFPRALNAAGGATCETIADADVPNGITIDLATVATAANAGDSATAFFTVGTVEAARLPALSGLTGAVTDGQVPDSITVTTAGTANALACTGCVGATEVAGLDAGDVTTGALADARVDGSLEADEVNPTLGSQTQGNYVATVATTAPLAGGAAGSEGGTLTLTVGDAAAGAKGVLQLAGDLAGTAAAPAVAPDAVALTTDTTGSYAAGDAEAGNATGVACTDCVALGGETSGSYAAGDAEAGAALTGDSATSFFAAGSLEVARGGAGAAPGADDQVLVADSTSAATWRSLPDSDAAGTILGYDVTTNTWSTKTDDDVPEAGDFGALSATAPITQSGGTISTSMATGRLLGRTTAGAGVAEEITPNATTLTLTAGALNVVDVTCTACLGTTEIAALDAADLTTGTLGVGVGATGVATHTTGAILTGGNGTAAMVDLVDAAVGQVLVSGGAATIPKYLAVQTCTSSASTTCTITVARSGCVPICGPGATAAGTNGLKSAAVVTTTLTCTFLVSGTNSCACLCP